MINDLIIVALILIGYGTVFSWILKFANWFMYKLTKGENNG